MFIQHASGPVYHRLLRLKDAIIANEVAERWDRLYLGELLPPFGLQPLADARHERQPFHIDTDGPRLTVDASGLPRSRVSYLLRRRADAYSACGKFNHGGNEKKQSYCKTSHS